MLYPTVCPFCGRLSPEGICGSCSKKIQYVREPYCMHCGKPLKDETAEFCSDCSRRKTYIACGRALWVHKEPVSKALYQFKYNNKRSWGRIFAAELAREYGEQIKQWGIQEIIPIPIHRAKKRKRGFNQAEILAEELAFWTGIPCRKDILFRIRNTMPLKQLEKKERLESLKGAFAVSGSWKPAENVLIIDDIYTTGATVERAAKMLRMAGTRNVYFLTISIGQGL